MGPRNRLGRPQRMLRVALRAALVPVVIALAMATAHAGVVIEGTRVVYPTDQREVVVRMTNKRTHPVLVESWIECPDETPSASQAAICKAPFALTPPLFRLEPNKGQTLRIFQTPGAMPTDRESLYYLNVRDIPPKGEGDHLAIAFRSRLKFFHRPVGLKVAAHDAPHAVRWTVTGQAARVDNPTPYFISIIAIEPEGGTTQNLDGVMVAPFATLDIPLDDGNALRRSQALHFTVVNDHGGPVRLTGKVE